MAPPKDLTGQRFSRLTVVKRVENTPQGKARWLCHCNCGGTAVATKSDLDLGRVKSCGCLRKERTAELGRSITSHSGTGTRLYRIWSSMKQRCNYEHNKSFFLYGGRGILICHTWEEDFANFRDWALANGYADHLTLDRIDVNGNYEPSNCRWVTMKAQQNNRRNNRLLTINGVTMTIAEWADRTGISAACISGRLSYGWPEQDLLMKPNLANAKIRREKHIHA